MSKNPFYESLELSKASNDYYLSFEIAHTWSDNRAILSLFDMSNAEHTYCIICDNESDNESKALKLKEIFESLKTYEKVSYDGIKEIFYNLVTPIAEVTTT